jgi:hypothetical protein
LDLWFESYGISKISATLWAGSKISATLWEATVNAAISAQNCPNLLKDKTLKFHQKSRF